MPLGVVEPLEVVDVGEHQRELRIATQMIGPRSFQLFVETAAIADARQSVDARLSLQFLGEIREFGRALRDARFEFMGIALGDRPLPVRGPGRPARSEEP